MNSGPDMVQGRLRDCPFTLILTWSCALIALLCATNASAQAAEKRVALVIGNGRYESAPLKNPPNDARLMGQSLRTLGFEVIEFTDSDQRTMKLAIEDFGRKIQDADVALFYFAGHGMQIAGRNYLIPIGANINAEGEVDIESVDVARVLAKMEVARTRVNLVILDACRNNPFSRSFRSQERGLAFVQAPTGTLIAYATAPGDVAADGAGDNGTFTGALATTMLQPGMTVESVFKSVRTRVKTQTAGRQVPWESSSLEGEFYFTLGAPGSTPPALPAQLAPSRKDLEAAPRMQQSDRPAADGAMGWQDVKKEGSQRVSFVLEDPEQNWELRTGDGRLMCRLPCTLWLDVQLGAYVTNDDRSERVKVVLEGGPSSLREMTLRPARGSPYIAGTATVVTGAFAITGAAVSATKPEGAKDWVFVSLFAGMAGASGYWWYWSRSEPELDSTQTTLERDGHTRGDFGVGVGPTGLAYQQTF
jgi:uncharacterized caspase-like protein